MLNVEHLAEVAGDYKVAYRQLQHAEKQLSKGLESLERDVDLARRRYELARDAFVRFALEEEDEFMPMMEEG